MALNWKTEDEEEREPSSLLQPTLIWKKNIHESKAKSSVEKAVREMLGEKSQKDERRNGASLTQHQW